MVSSIPKSQSPFSPFLRVMATGYAVGGDTAGSQHSGGLRSAPIVPHREAASDEIPRAGGGKVRCAGGTAAAATSSSGTGGSTASRGEGVTR